jgi:glucosyl-3-phosphoglycerate synthase
VQRFHHKSFADVRRLLDLKQAAGQRITVCIPTLNEAGTIGAIVRMIRSELVERVPLVDEILVVDSASVDATREIAIAEGAVVFASGDIAPETGTHPGKGENLWKSLHVARGSIICFIDGDIMNFHSGFVPGLVGPLLEHAEIDYVKAYYERPLAFGDATHAGGGGRVSEILVRPMISLFYPELADILQPLSGEYAARRGLLDTLSFPIGYGVEIAHLIDLVRDGRQARIAQVDLEKRIHRNRDDGDLGDTAFAILRVMLRRMERDGRLKLLGNLPEMHQRWLIDEKGIERIARHLPEPERPPLAGMR